MTQASHQMFPIRDRSDVGATRRAVDALARTLGIPERESGSAQIAATELGTNILRHGEDGYLLLRPLERPAGLELLAVDQGRGIADPAAALAGAGAAPGGLGVGLASVRRLATSFDLYTGDSRGTVVLGRFGADRPVGAVSGGRLRSGGISLPVVPEDRNGDGWAASHDGDGCCVLVIDGLGHGPPAHEAAQAGLASFDSDYDGDLCGWLQAANAAMRHTRGGVAALARIDLAEQRVWFAGIGNVQGRIVAADRQAHGFVSQPGMLGTEHQLPRPRLVDLSWAPGASLIMWSDGIRSGVAADPDGGLLRHDPTTVAAVLHRDFVRGSDDATVVVVEDRPGERP